MSAELRDRIRDWCANEDHVEATVGSDGAMSLRCRSVHDAAGAEPMIDVRVETSDTRIEVTHEFGLGSPTPAVAAQLPESIRRVLDQRSALLHGDMADGAELVRLRHVVFAEGCTKHELMAAVEEVVRARRQVLAAVGDLAGAAELIEALRADYAATLDVAAKTLNEQSGTHVTVTQPVPVRDANQQVIGQLVPGGSYPQLQQAQGWVLVQLEDGRQGWVEAAALYR